VFPIGVEGIVVVERALPESVYLPRALSRR
jgi:hypothetical protein